MILAMRQARSTRPCWKVSRIKDRDCQPQAGGEYHQPAVLTRILPWTHNQYFFLFNSLLWSKIAHLTKKPVSFYCESPSIII